MVFLPQSANIDLLDGVTSLPGSASRIGAGGFQTAGIGPIGDFGGPARSPSIIPREGLTLGGIGERLGQLGERTGQLGEQFREAAGPGITFGEQERETLRRAIDVPEAGVQAGSPEELARQEALGQARGIVGRQFQGPTQLDIGERTRIASDVGTLRGLAESLGRGRGLTQFVRQASPGLTPGQARFEAERRAPQLRQEARGLQQQARGVIGQLEQEQQQARELAQQRIGEAEEARAGARGFLEEERQARRTDVEAQQELLREQEEATSGAFREFQETGDIEALRGFVDDEALAEFEAAGEPERAAKAQFDQIMENPAFQEIREIDIADPAVDVRGQERRVVEIPADPSKPGSRPQRVDIQNLAEGRVRLPGRSLQESQRIGQLLNIRQRRLEAFFGFRTTTGATPFGSERRGRFALSSPILFGLEDLAEARPDVRGFAQFGGAADPTFQQAATGEQIEELNTLRNLLGIQGQLEQQEFTPGAIQAQPEEFAEAQEAVREQIERQAEKVEKAFATTRRRQRKAEKRRRRRKTVGRVLAGPSGLALEALTRGRPEAGFAFGPELALLGREARGNEEAQRALRVLGTAFVGPGGTAAESDVGRVLGRFGV